VSEYVKGLENKRNNNKSIVGVKKIIDYRIARENAIKAARHYELRIAREKMTQLKAELAQKDAKIIDLTDQPAKKKSPPKKKQPTKDEMRKQIEAEMRKQIEAEVRAEMEEMREQMDELILALKMENDRLKASKPTRKPREPKPVEYWEGQTENEVGEWEFINEDYAEKFADATFKDKKEYTKFMKNWCQPFAERKVKTANKRSAGGDATLLKATTSTNRCSANLWNNGDGCRCRFDGKFDATDWEGKAVKVCKNHKNSIDNAMSKYIDWKREYGYICGWWDQPNWREQHDTNKNRIRPDFKPKPRGKKD
jgi:hypothetical protein